MRKEDLFELLGELNDSIVQEAREPVRKKMNWKVPGTMAACLILMCIVFGTFPFTDRFGNSSEESPVAEEFCEAEAPPVEEEFSSADTPPETEAAAGDIAPMAYVNDTLYIQSSVQECYAERKEEFCYLGRIESTVSSDSEPDQNFQTNDPIVGCRVYQYGEDIVIEIDGRYWRYVKYEKNTGEDNDNE